MKTIATTPILHDSVAPPVELPTRMNTLILRNNNPIPACRPRCVAHLSLRALAALVLAIPASAPAETLPATIPFSDIGAKATSDYQGDALGISVSPDGARLRCGFQKLEAHVTREGLRLESTEAGAAGELRLIAAALGRRNNSSGTSQSLTMLPVTGAVSTEDGLVRFSRSGMTEEYSVSVGGVRQDFIVAAPPAGTGDLHVELALSGARADAGPGGARLKFEGSGRELAYTRLRVADATGTELTSHLKVLSSDRLALSVADANATYPVHIDPTFSDANWVSLNPGIAGANYRVSAVAVDGTGNVYVGGGFTFIGTVPANYIAKWNGTSWSALGSGMNATVVALAVSGTTLYAGGYFTTAGGVTARYIAKWDGSTWSALGSGMDGTHPNVEALAVSGSTLYAGGYFTRAGGVTANHVAKWNGTTWSALGSGMNARVCDLALMGTTLYAGGYFTAAGGVQVRYLAQWNNNNWSGLGSWFGARVSALAVSGSDLYAGGSFTNVGPTSVNYITKWNGFNWLALGSGMSAPVDDLTASGTNLYATGSFTNAGGLPVNGIAKWNGTVWSALGSGISGAAVLAASGTNLYAGGWFAKAGGVTANHIAKWNGNGWSALGSGMGGTYPSPYVYALATSGTHLYVGGLFTAVGGVEANNIAQWDGSAWSALGSGVNGDVNALAICGSNLYAGGSFNVAGIVPANYVAKWNGSTWSALGSGMNERVFALAVSGTDLYAGGRFGAAGGVPANGIAKWDGGAWSTLGSGLGYFSAWGITALAVSGSNLYAGGDFWTANGVTVKRIAKWDGSAWSALGSGFGESPSDGISVSALAANGNDLYAGGNFTAAGGVPANYVAKWDGTTWSGLGSGMNWYVSALAVYGNDLYAGGLFNTAGGVSANNVAKWNGGVWSALGSGISGSSHHVYALATDEEAHLFVGGDFYLAGTNVSPYIAQANLVVIPTNLIPPQVLSSPESRTVREGSTVEFRVTAFGSLPLIYQWFFNSTNAISDPTTNSALELVNVQLSQSGTYTVVVTNTSGVATSSPAMLDVVSATPFTNFNDAALRAVMADGGLVTFGCDGIITLTNTITITNDTVLDGTGREVTISGGNAVRVFHVYTNVDFTVVNLTIAGGLSGHGAGIFNDGGTVSLLNAELRGNSASEAALAAPDEYAGGALFNRGNVHATNCLFRGNGACASVFSYYPARGGAIRNEIGAITLVKCTFEYNQAWGLLSDYGPGTEGSGGAIYSQGSLHIRDCTFVQNSASGGPGWVQPDVCSACLGEPGGPSFGGAICNFGLLTVEGSLFVSNTVTGGDGSSGGGGFNCEEPYPPEQMDGAPGGAGGLAAGSALFSGPTANVINSTFVWNLARGGAGGGGGGGGPCYLSGGVGGSGGNGGDGGSAEGAISSSVPLGSCTLAFNSAIGGAGGPGGGGGFGGATPGLPGTDGLNGGAWGGITGAWLVNTLLATNTPVNAREGSITDAGHNLSSDSSCAFTNAGSLNNTDPNLGPLTDNGGPTLTMALLPGSPALDAGDTEAAPSTDQRGQPRPYNLVADIGAYEYQGAYSEWLLSYDLPTDGSMDEIDADGDGLNTWEEWRCRTCPTNALSVLRLLSALPDGNNVAVSWWSEAGVHYCVERSATLDSSMFMPLGTNVTGEPGVTTYLDSNSARMGPLFYRVRVGE